MLVDIGLPGMDGYEVASRIRVDQDLRSIMLVALTGYGREEDRDRSRARASTIIWSNQSTPTRFKALVARFVKSAASPGEPTIH